MMKSRDLAIVAFAVVLVAFSAPTVAQDYYITEDGVTVSLSPDVVEPGDEITVMMLDWSQGEEWGTA